LSDQSHLASWIVVIPLTPGEDWRTHPNHHALNDLMDHVRDTHKVEGHTFHILGYQQDGTDIASTWAGMSRQYFSSFIAVGGTPFANWDAKGSGKFLKGEGADLRMLLLDEAELAEGGALGEVSRLLAEGI
jgi:hypothetical protein